MTRSQLTTTVFFLLLGFNLLSLHLTGRHYGHEQLGWIPLWLFIFSFLYAKLKGSSAQPRSLGEAVTRFHQAWPRHIVSLGIGLGLGLLMEVFM